MPKRLYQRVDTDPLCNLSTSHSGSKTFPCFSFPCCIFLYSFPITESRVVHVRSEESTCIRQNVFVTPSLNPYMFATNYEHHMSISGSERNMKSTFLSQRMSIMSIYLCYYYCFVSIFMNSLR